MGPPDLTDVIHEAVNGVSVEIRRPIAERRIRRVRDAAERHVRNQIQRIQRGVPLRNIDAQRRPVYFAQIFRAVSQGILADTDNRLIEHRRRDRIRGVDTRPAPRLLEDDRRNVKIQRSVHPKPIGRVLQIRVIRQPDISLPARADLIIQSQNLRAPVVTARLRREVIPLVQPARTQIRIVRHRKNIQNILADLRHARHRQHISRELDLIVQRILYGNQLAVHIEGFRKIALAFQRGGHGNCLGPVSHALVLELLRPEEEQLVAPGAHL